MFYLERKVYGRWMRFPDKMLDSTEKVKSRFKCFVVSGHISKPQRWSYRIVDEQGVSYFTFDGLTKTGRCKWKWTFQAPKMWEDKA